MKSADENKYVLVVAAVIHRGWNSYSDKDSNKNFEVAIFRRGPGSSGSGHYEFPGGKVEAGESEVQALRREIVEELGVSIEVGSLIGETFHKYPAKNIHLRFYWVEDPRQAFILCEHDDHRWVNVHEIDVNILSEGDREIVKVLQSSPPITTKD